MSNAGNPFTAEIIRRGIDTDALPTRSDVDDTTAILVVAESLWDVIDEFPGKAEGTLAKRRLEEAVFWAGRAAEPPAPQPES